MTPAKKEVRKIKVKEMSFFMPMKKVPTATAQQKQFTQRGGKTVAYDPDNVKAAKQLFEAKLIPHVPSEKIVGKPIRLKTMWLFETKDKKKHGKYKLTRPDTDNSVKLLKDTMTRLQFWEDDALVVVDEIHKYWAPEGKSGIYVEIVVLEEI